MTTYPCAVCGEPVEMDAETVAMIAASGGGRVLHGWHVDEAKVPTRRYEARVEVYLVGDEQEELLAGVTAKADAVNLAEAMRGPLSADLTAKWQGLIKAAGFADMDG